MALPNQCPLCTASYSKQIVVTKHVFGDSTDQRAFFKCLECEIIYLYPRLNPDDEKNFYASEFEKFMSSRAGEAGGWLEAEKHIIANKDTYRRREKYLSRFTSKPKDILEIGCSSGFMLYPLEKDGHNCTGIEPSGVFLEFLNNKKIKAYGSLDELLKKQPSQKYDLIMHFFVMEHISNPLEFLREQLKLLKPGGQIVLEIPNAADPLYSVYDIPEFEKFYWSIAHPWYFNEKSLQNFLQMLANEFEIILDQRYDLSNHMIWALKRKPGGQGKFHNKLGSAIDDNYRRGLIESGFCDTLVAVIRK